jgi:hypothetical protein
MLAPEHDDARKKVFETLTANPQNLAGALTTGRFEEPLAIPAVSRLGEVRVPTLILVGEYDIPDVHAHAGAIELGIGGAHREIVSDAGHLMQVDVPSVVQNRIAGFIAETPTFAVSPQRLRDFAGTYTPFAGDRPGSFLVSEGRFIARFKGVRDAPLFASSDSTFYALVAPQFGVTFHRPNHDSPTVADISIGGRVHRAVKITPRR